MTKTITELAAELRALNSQDFVIYARTVLESQSVQLSAEQRAHLVRKADLIREITEETGKQNLAIEIRDIYARDVVIGKVNFSL